MRMLRPIVIVSMLGLVVLAGCAGGAPGRTPSVIGRQRLAIEGSIQGAARRGDALWVYADADPGALVACSYDAASRSVSAGAVVARFTRGGVDVVPHPTGLAFGDGLAIGGGDLPTFLGDTVRQKGLIHAIDFDRMLETGTLDEAILNTCLDDRATNGCRPVYVRFDPDGAEGPAPERWVIATADYGDAGNALRLLEPTMLARATRTSAEGVLIAEFPAPTFVQNLCWIDGTRTLVFVQNRTAGRGFRLSFARFVGGPKTGSVRLEIDAPVDFEGFDEELEGFVMLGGSVGLLVSDSRAGAPNAVLIELDPRND